MGFSGLSIATSGLRVAHTQLAVTGHNMANAEIRGFSRQRIVQKEATALQRGLGSNGVPNMLGLGVDRNAVMQLRNELLDFTYRAQVGQLAFHSTRVTVGREIEGLLGELHGGYNFQSVLNDMWYSIQELTAFPDGITTRRMLLSTTQTFLTKAQEVYRGLMDFQINLDLQIRDAVQEINSTVARINELNEIIRNGEIAGDNANDFRDLRNLAIDQLAELIPITVHQDRHGEIQIFSGGHAILTGGVQNLLGLRYTSNEFNFVEPVFTTSPTILSAGTPPGNFVSFINYAHPIHTQNNNDQGRLKALLMARGMSPTHHMSGQVPTPQERLTALTQEMEASWDALEAIAIAEGHGVLFTNARTARDGADPALAFTTWETLVAALDTTDPATAALVNATRTLTTLQQTATTDLAADTHNHMLLNWSVQNGMIPRVMMQLDSIVYSVVRMLNDTLTGRLRVANPDFEAALNAAMAAAGTNDPSVVILDPHDPSRRVEYPVGSGTYVYAFQYAFPGQTPLDRSEPPQPGIPLFVRRTDLTGSPAGTTSPLATNASVWNTVYTIENLQINPLLLQQGGHNLLALSLSGAPGDTDLMVALHGVWQANNGPYAIELGGRLFSIQDGYIRFTNMISIEVNEAIRFTDAQTQQVIQADNMRQAVKGVSMDEELGSMLRFQYAFQAASRVISLIDGMIETIINVGRR